MGDEATGKRTLVVRLGPAASARLYLAVLLTAYAVLPILVVLGLPPLVVLANIFGLPLAAWQGWQVAHGAWADPARWEALSFGGIVLLMGTAVADVAAFVVLGLLPRIG
jgi:4-hydroxybenzoate polyprenyltransferase